MSLKWKCVDSSFLVLKNETPDNEETGVSDMDEQPQIPVFVEQQCCEVTRLTECDTKNGISLGELSGYTVNTETYNTMPSTQLLPPAAEQTKQYIETEPVKDTLEYSRVNDTSYSIVTDTSEYVVGNCENVDNRHSCDSTDKQMQKICIRCEKYSNCQLDLSIDMMDSHVDMKKCTCSLCGKSFLHNSCLEKHMLVHIDETTPEDHMGIRTDKRPHSCPECEESFRTLKLFQQHMRIHTIEKPHSCRKCDKVFSTLSALKRHLTVQHEKLHSCSKCEKSFRTFRLLKQHMRVHSDYEPHGCTECYKCFMTLRSLTVHMRKVHTGVSHSCTECDKSFRTLSKLQQHTRVHNLV